MSVAEGDADAEVGVYDALVQMELADSQLRLFAWVATFALPGTKRSNTDRENIESWYPLRCCRLI